jgi:hypothetical protein
MTTHDDTLRRRQTKPIIFNMWHILYSIIESVVPGLLQSRLRFRDSVRLLWLRCPSRGKLLLGLILKRTHGLTRIMIGCLQQSSYHVQVKKTRARGSDGGVRYSSN